MSTHLTSQQFRVTDPQKNFWVTASAGSGKTKVLTDRMVRLMLEGVPPHCIVCLTFTKKAAAEMMHRLTQQFSRWVLLDRPTLCQELTHLFQKEVNESLCVRVENVAQMLGSSPPLISTLHGFCHYLIQKFPLEAGVSMPVSVMDEAQSLALWQRACDKVIYSVAIDSPEAKDFLALAEKKASFREDLEEMYYARSRFFFKRDSFEGVSDPTCGDSWPPHPLILDQDEELSVKEKDWIQNIQKEQRFSAQYMDFFMTKAGAPRKNIATHSVLSRWIAQEQSILKDYCQKVYKYQEFQYAYGLIRIFSLVLAQYESMKAGALDFDDLSAHALNLLEDPSSMGWVSYSLDHTFHHVLVDEAQDTDPSQWRLLKNLFEILMSDPKKTFFVVGDPKQSIYSFQGAHVQLFHDMKEYFQQWCAQQNRPFETATLALSFRSTPAVIEAVNRVFKDSDLTVDPFPHHHTFQQHLKGTVELSLLQELSPDDLAAQWVQCIQTWLKNPFYLETQQRALRASDIMILLPRRTSVFHSFTEQLRRQGLVTGGDLVSQHPFVKDLLAVARWVLHPHDDEALWDVLNGSLLPGSAELLFSLAYQRGSHSLWQRLCYGVESGCSQMSGQDIMTLSQQWIQKYQEGQNPQFPSHVGQDQGIKLMTGAKGLQAPGMILPDQSMGKMSSLPPYYAQLVILKSYLDSWRSQVSRGGVFSFFHTLIYAQGGLIRASRALGSSLKEIADEFLELVISCPEKDDLSASGAWLALRRFPSHVGQSQGVKLMTIHGAKGLQAPVVILPDLPPALSRRSSWEKVMSQSNEDQKKEDDQEYWRLFYVAMTRAQDRLYMSSRQEKGWYQKVSSSLGGGVIRQNLQELHETFQESFAEISCEQKDSLKGYTGSLEGLSESSVMPFEQDGKGQTGSLEAPASVSLKCPVSYPESCLKETKPLFSHEGNENSHHKASDQEELGKISQYPGKSLKSLVDQKILGRALHQILDEVAHSYTESCPSKIQSFLGHYTSPQNAVWWAEQIHSLLTSAQLKVLWQQGKGEVDFIFSEKSIRIDRLLISDRHVWVVDFKSSGRPSVSWDDCPYKDQLCVYEEKLSPLFPAHQIHKGILWLASGQIQWAPGSLCFTEILR